MNDSRALIPTPHWPLYEKRCEDWCRALKQLHGDFRRSPFDEAVLRFLSIAVATAGFWLTWATTFGPQSHIDAPWQWVLAASGIGLAGLALIGGIRALSRCYRFADGEVCEVFRNDFVQWRESLATLQRVTFAWTGTSRVPPTLRLHWTTHHRTLELFPSMDAAVREFLRAERAIEMPPQSTTDWLCIGCNESNPKSFEVCWHCGNAAPARHRQPTHDQ